jgi:hypothetical protein
MTLAILGLSAAAAIIATDGTATTVAVMARNGSRGSRSAFTNGPLGIGTTETMTGSVVISVTLRTTNDVFGGMA